MFETNYGENQKVKILIKKLFYKNGILELYIISETKNTLGRYNSGLAQQKIELVNCKIGQ